MRMAGTSWQFVSSQSFRGEMARKRAASAGRRSRGSWRESRRRASGWIGLVFSIGMPPGATAPSGQPKHGGAVTSNTARRRALDERATGHSAVARQPRLDTESVVSGVPARAPPAGPADPSLTRIHDAFDVARASTMRTTPGQSTSAFGNAVQMRRDQSSSSQRSSSSSSTASAAARNTSRPYGVSTADSHTSASFQPWRGAHASSATRSSR